MHGHISLLSCSQIICDLQKSLIKPILFPGKVRLRRFPTCMPLQLPTVSFLSRSMFLCDLLSALCWQLPLVSARTSQLFLAPVFSEAQYYQSFLKRAWDAQYLSPYRNSDKCELEFPIHYPPDVKLKACAFCGA